MSSVLKILCGFAVILMLIKMILPSEKFKPYVEMMIGLGILVMLITPIKSFFDEKMLDFDVSLTTFSEADYRENIGNYAQNYAESAMKRKVSAILKESYPEYRCTVRTVKQSDVTRLYISTSERLTSEVKSGIKLLIIDEIGIKSDYVTVFDESEEYQ